MMKYKPGDIVEFDNHVLLVLAIDPQSIGFRYLCETIEGEQNGIDFWNSKRMNKEGKKIGYNEAFGAIYG